MRPSKHAWRVMTAITAALLLAAAAWYTKPIWHPPFRLQPAPIEKQLFEGVKYFREVHRKPRPAVVHLVQIDLSASGLSSLVTPRDYRDSEGRLPLVARRTSVFLQEHKLQLAVNGGYFKPFHSRGYLDYYPHPGDPVEPIGLTASRGNIYGPHRTRRGVLFISEDGRASFDAPIGKVYNAIAGDFPLIEKGRVSTRLPSGLGPRTAAGLDRGCQQLTLVVVDGRQPGYSEGCSLKELAHILLRRGVHNGVNLDGGGSSTLVIEDASGKPLVLNSSIDCRIPGRERAVATHLGLFAKRAGPGD